MNVIITLSKAEKNQRTNL